MDSAIKARNSGFTLIEVLVSVAVMAVLAVGITLSVGGRAQDPLAQDRARFIALFEDQQRQAIHGRRNLGLVVDVNGVQRSQQVAGQGEAADALRWQTSDQTLQWRSRVQINTHTASFGVPNIVFLPDGRSTAFAIRFRNGESSLGCTSDGGFELTCEDG